MHGIFGSGLGVVFPLAGSVVIYLFALTLPGREELDPENDVMVQRLFWTGHLLAVGGLIMAWAVLG
jgi:hypothetical protein